jgi:transcriptional regulator with XRE-family HTH domain
MAKPKHRTTLSVLRTILGPINGHKTRFGQELGKSDSWITKVSCGKIPLTIETAKAIAYETGISLNWLMANDPKAPPLDRWGGPYTKESYAKHRTEWGVPVGDFNKCIEEAQAILAASSLKNKNWLFIFMFEEFLNDAKKRFGTTKPDPTP